VGIRFVDGGMAVETVQDLRGARPWTGGTPRRPPTR
jgi:hypothetical protein